MQYFTDIDTLQVIAKEHGRVVLPLPLYSPEPEHIEKVWANARVFKKSVDGL